LTKWGAVFVMLGLVFWLVILPRMQKTSKTTVEAPITNNPTSAVAQTIQPAVKPIAGAGQGPGVSVTNATDAAVAAQEAETKRLAEQQAALEAAQEKSAAEAKEKARLEAEKAAQVAADAKAKMLAEEKRIADEKARAELAAQQATNVTVAAVAPAKLTTTPDGTVATDKTAIAETPVKTQVRREMTNGIGMELVWIEKMPGTKDGGYVGKYEVTQAQYLKVMGANPSEFSSDLKHPVENVSWNEAMNFCRKLTTMEQTARSLTAGQAYSLPTQPQWDFYLADAKFDDAVTSRNAAQKSPAPVGSTRISNRYGLYDVLGNVWEWCLDDSSSAEKTLKGGAYNTLKTFSFKPMIETTPMKRPPDAKSDEIGFRCVLVSMP
jgi:formylglycine-generating enzyme required for sulfatase activity